MTDSTTAASPATTDTTAAPREVRLVSRPVGWPTHADFEVVDSELPDLADGQIRVRNTVMSVDPYMRGRMSAAKSYAAPYAIGEAMTARSASSRSHAPRVSPSVTTCCTASGGARSLFWMPRRAVAWLPQRPIRRTSACSG